jgi:signal transduction histidine kinase
VVFDDISDQLAVDRMKNEFVAVVSHELRTPLTSLRGSLGLLAAGIVGDLSPEGQRMTSVAVASTDRLVRLVDDILDLERLVSGHVALERRPHRLTDVVRTAVEAVAGAAEEAGVVLHVDVDPVSGWLDADRMVQVLVNLLGNAVKFSSAGSAVTVRGRHADDHVLLEVEDCGRGIPADRLDTVFERFAQVDSSDSREHGGTGLGLAIARNVVEAHDGTIAVRSEVGAGTTFTVTLPQRIAGSPRRSGGRRLDDAGEQP